MRLLIAAVLLLLPLSAFAQQDVMPAKCEFCGLPWSASPTRIEAIVSTEQGEKIPRQYESFDCLFNAMLKDGTSLVKLSIIDYSTAGTETEVMLDGDKAWYVYGTTQPIAATRPPYIIAFATQAAAAGAAQTIGGDVLVYKQMLQRLEQERQSTEVGTDGSAASANPDDYICPCTGGCCDHVVSETPGECPDCGMTLIKRSEKERQDK